MIGFLNLLSTLSIIGEDEIGPTIINLIYTQGQGAAVS